MSYRIASIVRKDLLCERQKEGTWRDLARPPVHTPNGPSSQAEARGLDLHPGLSYGWRGPNTWATALCLHRCTSRETHQSGAARREWALPSGTLVSHCRLNPLHPNTSPHSKQLYEHI